MRKQFFFYCIALAVVFSCNDNNTVADSSIKENNSPVITSSFNDSLAVRPLMDTSIIDDSVFADGSIPTSWEVAGITNVSALKKFINDLQEIIAADRKEELAEQIRYPLNKVTKTKADFVANYDRIVNKKVKEALAQVKPRQLFRNYQGVMIGTGEIWIVQEGKGFKIIAINN